MIDSTNIYVLAYTDYAGLCADTLNSKTFGGKIALSKNAPLVQY